MTPNLFDFLFRIPIQEKLFPVTHNRQKRKNLRQ